MIIKPRILTKEEIEKHKKYLIELGKEGFFILLIERGWCLESAISISDAVYRDLGE